MFSYVFIIGPGRCGSNLVRGLLEGNPALDVFPGEVTNFLAHLHDANGGSGRVNLEHSMWQLVNELLDGLFDDADLQPLRTRVADDFGKRLAGGTKHLSAKEFLDMFCASVLDKRSGIVVLNVAGTSAAGYLDAFPGCKVIHMLRHPLTQMNSRYRMRHADVNSFGGTYPGTWEFGKAFKHVRETFHQAKIHRNHDSVFVLRMEDLQDHTEKMITEVCQFLEVSVAPENLTPTRRGKAFKGTRAGQATETKTVFQSDLDWSCLTPNDLHYCSRFDDARAFYEFPVFPNAKNGLWLFLRRQLGFYGANRTWTLNPIRFIKVLLIAFPQYIQDLCEKHGFEYHLEYLRKRP